MAQASHPWLGLAWLLLALLLPACGRPERGDDPVSTVRSFLDLMERSGADEAALAEAYALLDESTQQALRARAERARSLSGRSFEPWQMLVQGRFRLRFALVSPGGLRARVEGARTTVVATGQRPGERAEIPLVREGDAWRIVLSLPPLRSETLPATAPPPARQAGP